MGAAEDSAGVFERFYPNGQREFEIEYMNARLHGRMRRWYEDGTLWLEAFNIDDSQDGPFKRYYPSGELKQEGTFKEGLFHGSVTQYTVDGDVQWSLEFNMGEPVDV